MDKFGDALLKTCSVLERPIYVAYSAIQKGMWRFFEWVYRK